MIYIIIDFIQGILSCIISIAVSTEKYDEGLVFLKEALDIRRSFLGNTHPDTLASINNIGDVLQAQGDINNANMI